MYPVQNAFGRNPVQNRREWSPKVRFIGHGIHGMTRNRNHPTSFSETAPHRKEVERSRSRGQAHNNCAQGTPVPFLPVPRQRNRIHSRYTCTLNFWLITEHPDDRELGKRLEHSSGLSAGTICRTAGIILPPISLISLNVSVLATTMSSS